MHYNLINTTLTFGVVWVFAMDFQSKLVNLEDGIVTVVGQPQKFSVLFGSINVGRR